MGLSLRLSTATLAIVMAAGTVQAAEVNVYTSRKDHLIKPVLEDFTKDTGIKVNMLSASEDQLLERLKTEGANSPADLLIVTDAANLHKARVAGVLQPIKSDTLDKNVPAAFRDPQGYWYGLTARSRVIFYAKDRVKPGEITSYEDLADPKWKGRICMRSSSAAYNQSLLAGIIAVHGPAKAETWAKGVTENMARKPQGGDRDQISAVAAGQCDLAVANTYYYGGMITSEKEAEREAAAKVGVLFPNQDGRGAHMNVSGGGLTVSAKHKSEAVKLLEYLSGPKAQAVFAQANNEFPILPGAPQSPVTQAWGTFKPESLNVAMLGENSAEAIRIFDRVGWR